MAAARNTSPEEGKNVLIVYAHPKHESFNGALLQTAVDVLSSQGHNVVVSDLYKMKFDPLVRLEDFSDSGLANFCEKVRDEVYAILRSGQSSFPLPLVSDSGSAYVHGFVQDESKDRVSLPTASIQSPALLPSVSDSGPYAVRRDIQEEVDKVERADLVVFQFPLYWCSFPAILKGWMDRVIQAMSGFVRKTGFYEEGALRGKLALLSFTTGAPSIPAESLEAMLLPMQVVTLNAVGFDVLNPQVSFGVENATEETLKKYITDWTGRLSTVFEEPTPEMLTVDTWAKKHSSVS